MKAKISFLLVITAVSAALFHRAALFGSDHGTLPRLQTGIAARAERQARS
jgi:hypothetical protein